MHTDTEAVLFTEEKDDEDLDDDEEDLVMEQTEEEVSDIPDQVVNLLLPSNISSQADQLAGNEGRSIEMDLRKGETNNSLKNLLIKMKFVLRSGK